MCITDVRIRPGDVLFLGPDASPQFTDENAINVRVISVTCADPETGWVWLDVYVLNRLGNATDRRSLYVRAAGAHQPRPKLRTAP